MTLLRVVKQLESEDPKLALPGVVNPRRLVPVDPPKLWRADEAFCGQLRRDVVNFSHQPRLAYLRTVQASALIIATWGGPNCGHRVIRVFMMRFVSLLEQEILCATWLMVLSDALR